MFGANADVLHRNVGDAWPLIRRILADDVYAARYRTALEDASRGLLAPDAFERRARTLHALVAPSVIGERGERPSHSTITSAEGFTRALDGADGLLARVRARQELVRSTLAAVPK